MAKRKKSRKASRKSNSKKGPKAWGKNLYGENWPATAGGIGGAIAGQHYAPELVNYIADLLGTEYQMDPGSAMGIATKVAGGIGGWMAGKKAGKWAEDELKDASAGTVVDGDPINETWPAVAGGIGGAIGGASYAPDAVNYIAKLLGTEYQMDPQSAMGIATKVAGGIGGWMAGKKVGRWAEDELKDASAGTVVDQAPINEQQAIARFVVCLNEKNYALANKYLQAILESKTRRRIAEQGQQYK